MIYRRAEQTSNILLWEEEGAFFHNFEMQGFCIPQGNLDFLTAES